jgi:hypothetical protein
MLFTDSARKARWSAAQASGPEITTARTTSALAKTIADEPIVTRDRH